MRDEFVRTQAEPGARGGGGIPLAGEQRLLQAVSGSYAWNQVEQNPPGPALWLAADRLYQLWITPHGVIKAAIKHNATAETQTEGGKKMTIISFAVPGEFKVKAFVNERNLVERVDSWNPNPVLGDMLTETTYADYKDFGGVQFSLPLFCAVAEPIGGNASGRYRSAITTAYSARSLSGRCRAVCRLSPGGSR